MNMTASPSISENTEPTKVEAELRRKQAILERAESLAHMGSWNWIVETDTVTWSNELFRIFQRNPADGAPSFAEHQDLYHPEDFRRLSDAVRDAVTNGIPYEMELRAIRKDGQTLTCFARGVPEIGPDRQVKVVFGSLEDITERKKRDQEFERMSHRLMIATRAAGVGIWEYDVGKNELTWDDTMYSLYGISRQTFSGEYEAWRSGVHPDDQMRGNNEIEQALAGTAEFNTTFRVVWPSGEVHWIRAVAVVLRDDKGEPLRMVGTNWDVTAEKVADQAKAEFVSTVSHELRTPLTSISGSLGLVIGGALGVVPPMMQSMLEVAHRNSMRLTHLINDLLDMEKLASGKLGYNLQGQLLSPLIEECLSTMRSYADQYKVSFVIDQRDDDVKVKVDGSRLQQVIANFLSNAAKFSPAGAQITIKVIRRDNVVRTEVIDRGSGIPDEFRNQIFQKFSQADSSDTKQRGGTGLGLAISKELIEGMSGQVGFHSEAGQGAIFYFELPIWQADV